MATTTVWAVPCALGAAAAFGIGNVAQMRAARRVESSDRLDPRLLGRLVKDKLWLFGLLAGVVGFGLQAVALFLAPVVLVQPLIVAELLFALPLAAFLANARLGPREWSGALLVSAGLAMFMLVANPSGQRTQVAPSAWVAMVAAIAVVVVVLTAIAERARRRPMLRATALAAGASACFGLMSVETKVVGHQLADEKVHALTHPQPWLLLVTACAGLLLGQTAFRIAPLSVSLPIIDIGEPVVASLLAVFAFGEHVGHGLSALLLAAFAAAIAVVGVGMLDSSPLVRSAQDKLNRAPEEASRALGVSLGSRGARRPAAHQ
jgi:drug/metabolite transporter (DMT)-like permease